MATNARTTRDQLHSLARSNGRNGSYKLDAIIVTTCSPDIQRSRLMTRNQVSQATAQQWIDSQMPLSEKEAIADVIIHNNGTLAELEIQTQNAWTLLLDKMRAL